MRSSSNKVDKDLQVAIPSLTLVLTLVCHGMVDFIGAGTPDLIRHIRLAQLGSVISQGDYLRENFTFDGQTISRHGTPFSFICGLVNITTLDLNDSTKAMQGMRLSTPG